MTFSREDKRSEVRARCSDQLADRLETFADQHGVAKSEVIREALDGHLPSDESVGPQDPDLRETWRWLRDRADDRGLIESEPAVSELAQQLGMKEKFVKTSRLRPLERKGWIVPNYSTIRVIDQ